MSFAPVGDLARHLLIRRHTAQIKSDLNRLADMMASGRQADIGAAQRGNLAPLTGLEASLSRLGAWELAGTGLSTQMEAMQSALSAMRKLGETGANAFLHAKLPQQIERASAEAFDTLEALLGHLNTRVGDDWIFAGVASDGAAVGSAEDLLTALAPALAGLDRPEDVEAAILAWMSAPTGFPLAIYQGGDAVPAVGLSLQDRLAHGITATDPGFAKVLAAAAMGALLGRGLFATDPAARSKTVELTAELYLTSASDGVYLAGRLGHSQARLERLTLRTTAERAALEIERSEILRADPEQTASDLTQTSAQLDLLYAMTARLSSLTLLNALR